MSGMRHGADPLVIEDLLTRLRLPAIRSDWERLVDKAETESWSAACFLQVLAEHELAGREQRRIERHLADSGLLPGKSLDSFDFPLVPMVRKSQVLALAEDHSWLKSGDNVLLFGPPGVGKTHLGCALGRALVDGGWRVLFSPTSVMVQRLQKAKMTRDLPAELTKLDKYHLLILDDFTYAYKDEEDASVLYELIARRYEQRSVLITANQPFGEWHTVFPSEAMAVSAADKLSQQGVILEMNVKSYRYQRAKQKKDRRKSGE